MEGDVDFIFGSATAYFVNCTFFSKYTGEEISSYVTAASTPKDQEYGYVMANCHFESNCPPGNAYLGRTRSTVWQNASLKILQKKLSCPERTAGGHKNMGTNP